MNDGKAPRPVWSAEPVRLRPEPGVDLAERMIFVVGNSRTGTSMMGRVLGRHPAVFTFRELHFFEQLWSPAEGERQLPRETAQQLAARLLCIRHDRYLTQGDPERYAGEARQLLRDVDPARLTPGGIFERFLRSESVAGGRLVPCDQTPRNVFYIREILRLYPGARVINMVRDPRDILLSQKRKWKRRTLGSSNLALKQVLRYYINYHPITMSELWKAAVSAADHFAEDPRVLTVHFEKLVAEPEQNLRRVCDFVGVSYDRSLLMVPQVGSSIIPDQPERKGIDPNRAGHWRKGGLHGTEIYLCQAITGPLMKAHGYERADVRPNPLRLAYYAISLPLKLAVALFVNMGRVRNMGEAVRRRLAS